MSAIYQMSLNPNIYQNISYKQIQYIPTPILYSPQKNIDTLPFNYGMKHYYSAELKSDRKVNNDYKPIYISNPQFVLSQPINNNILTQNRLYPVINQVQITPSINLNNMNNNTNLVQANINNIHPQINLNQSIANDNILYYYNTKTNKVNNNNILLSPQRPNYNNNSIYINEQIVYNGYPQQNIYSKNTISNSDKNYYNIEESRSTEAMNNSINNMEINNSNFNNTMPGLKNNNEIYNQWKNEFNENVIDERKTYQENHKILENPFINSNFNIEQENNINNNNITNINLEKNNNIYPNVIINQKLNQKNQR